MKSHVQVLGVCFLVFALLFFALTRDLQLTSLSRRTTSLEIHVLPFAGGKSEHLLCRLNDGDARLAASQFRRNDKKWGISTRNLCLNPTSNNWYRLDFYSGTALIQTVDIQLDTGQTYPYVNNRLYDLTNPSLSYFRSLIAKQKSLAVHSK